MCQDWNPNLFEHIKYRNLICIMYKFPSSYQYFAMQFFSSEYYHNSNFTDPMSDNVKIGTFMLKISRLLLLKDFKKKILKIQEN